MGKLIVIFAAPSISESATVCSATSLFAERVRLSSAAESNMLELAGEETEAADSANVVAILTTDASNSHDMNFVLDGMQILQTT